MRETAHAVLQQRQYAQWRHSDAILGWLAQLRDWLAAFADRLDALHVQAPLLYWLIVGALALTCVLLLAHVVWSIRVALGGAAAAPAEPPGASGSLTDDAEGLARQGRFLEAARRLQLAVIELLLRQRAITLSRFEPNRILRERLQRSALAAAEQREVLRLVQWLEIAWFRDRVEDAALYRAWQSLYRRLARTEST